MGAILKTLYIPPTIAIISGVLRIIAIVATIPPRANAPVSPIIILAGKELNLKNPNSAPDIHPQKIAKV